MARASLSVGATTVARPEPVTLLAFVTVVVTGGLNAIAVRQTLGELTPFWSAALRFLLAALVMFAIVLITGRSFPRGRSLMGAIAYGVVGFAASYAFIYSGLVEAPASAGAVLLALAPLFTFGLAILQGQERFRPEGLVGAVVALIGVVVIFADQLGAEVPIASLVLVVLGVLCIAEAGVIVKWIPRSDPFGTNAVAMVSGGSILLALTLVSGEPMAVPTGQPAIGALLYLVVLGTVVLFGAYVYALTRWTASAVSYSTLLMPLVAVPTAALLTGEPITAPLLVGGAIILAGVYVGAFLRRPRRWSASSAPECLPVDGCPEVAPARVVAGRDAASPRRDRQRLRRTKPSGSPTRPAPQERPALGRPGVHASAISDGARPPRLFLRLRGRAWLAPPTMVSNVPPRIIR